jgi:hypothetical protein
MAARSFRRFSLFLAFEFLPSAFHPYSRALILFCADLPLMQTSFQLGKMAFAVSPGRGSTHRRETTAPIRPPIRPQALAAKRTTMQSHTTWRPATEAQGPGPTRPARPLPTTPDGSWMPPRQGPLALCRRLLRRRRWIQRGFEVIELLYILIPRIWSQFLLVTP